ncbi:NADH-quinone oxidoreductase subunit C [Thermoflexales bacterium]|nr:NADH-quinone oxidoreductase subunit C [Thermoflexales bacterium]
MSVGIFETIRTRFPEAITASSEFRGETTFVVQPDQLIAVCTFLRDDPAWRFDLLSDVSAVDHFPARPRFAVNYHLYSLENNYELRLKVWLDGEQPQVASVTSVWPGANWHEREVWDLMGIKFGGHPDPRRIFLPEDFLGHPLRKDAGQFYEEPQFMHNFDLVESQKAYAKE